MLDDMVMVMTNSGCSRMCRTVDVRKDAGPRTLKNVEPRPGTFHLMQSVNLMESYQPALPKSEGTIALTVPTTELWRDMRGQRLITPNLRTVHPRGEFPGREAMTDSSAPSRIPFTITATLFKATGGVRSVRLPEFRARTRTVGTHLLQKAKAAREEVIHFFGRRISAISL